MQVRRRFQRARSVTPCRCSRRSRWRVALASTDHDHLRFYRPDATKAGFVLLIWENGDDAASDWSDNDETNALVMPVLRGLGVL